MKLVVGITGASGINLAVNFINNLPNNIEVFVIFSKAAKKTFKLENNKKLKDFFLNKKNLTLLKDSNLGSCTASGSFKIDKMIILPCSINTLAKCASGISDSLITRTFSVMLKENKDIILAIRETPFNQIILQNMLSLSKMGVTIAPPILGYYSKQKTLKDMEDFLIGKWFDLLKIDNNLYKRWK